MVVLLILFLIGSGFYLYSRFITPKPIKPVNENNSECAGWYAASKYGAKNNLKNLSEIEDIAEKKGYSLFDDGVVNFYFPEKWKVETDKYDKINTKHYKIYYLEYIYLDILIDNVENFKTAYKMCINRCFDDGDATAFFSYKARFCSENYSEENLEKLLAGTYINYLSTGSMPPGGVGAFIFSKVDNNTVISASYSSEDRFSYPKAKELYAKKSWNWNDSSDEEKKIIYDEWVYYEQEFYKIIKSFKIR